MRILWLNANLLLPLDKGGKLRTWHLMRHLAQRHEITYLSFADPDTTQAERDGMREVCAHLRDRAAPRCGQGQRRLLRRRRRARPRSAAVRCRQISLAGLSRARATRLLASGRFDLVVCDFLVPAVNMPRPAALPGRAVHAQRRGRDLAAALRAADRSGAAGSCSPPAVAAHAALRGRHDRAASTCVLAVSDVDRDTLQRLYPKDLTAPVVHRRHRRRHRRSSRRARRRANRRRHLVFTGSMDWIPNEDAMTHFCRDILPRIRAQQPDVRCRSSVAHRRPPSQRLARDSPASRSPAASTTCATTSAERRVYIVPIRIGGGTRLKIFEAMGMAKAVVSTTIGAEGLPVTDDARHRHRRRPADTSPRRSSAAAARPGTARAARAAARELVVTHYDWSAVAGQLEQALVEAAGVRPAAAADLQPDHSHA